MNVPEVLTRKVGPLPVGGWIIALAGGIGVAVVIRRQASDSGAFAEGYEQGEQAGYDSVSGDDDFGLGGNTYTNPGAGNLSGTLPAPAPVTPAPTKPLPPITTNAQWRNRALSVLTRRGYKRAVATTSLRKWFARKELLEHQRHVINEAITVIGWPPNPPKRPGPRSQNPYLGGSTTPAPRQAAPSVPQPARRDTGTNTNPGR